MSYSHVFKSINSAHMESKYMYRSLNVYLYCKGWMSYGKNNFPTCNLEL